MRKLYCVNKAEVLPINIEDASRSEIEFEKASQVMCGVYVSRCY